MRRLIRAWLAIERPDKIIRSAREAERRCWRWPAERLAVDEKRVGHRIFDRLQTLAHTRFVRRHDAAGDHASDLLECEALVLGDGIVVGEERILLDAEEGEKILIQRLLIHAKKRKDSRLLP